MSEWEEDNVEDGHEGDEAMSDGDSSSLSVVSSEEVCTSTAQPLHSNPYMHICRTNTV